MEHNLDSAWTNACFHLKQEPADQIGYLGCVMNELPQRGSGQSRALAVEKTLRVLEWKLGIYV
jgi:hypothetical protein